MKESTDTNSGEYYKILEDQWDQYIMINKRDLMWRVGRTLPEHITSAIQALTDRHLLQL